MRIRLREVGSTSSLLTECVHAETLAALLAQKVLFVSYPQSTCQFILKLSLFGGVLYLTNHFDFDKPWIHKDARLKMGEIKRARSSIVFKLWIYAQSNSLG